MAPAVTPGVSSVFPPSPCLPPPLCFLCICVYVGMASRHSAPVQSPHLHRHVINFYLKALVSPPLVAKLFCHPQVVYTLGRAVPCCVYVSFILRCFYSSCLQVIIVLLCSDCLCLPCLPLPAPENLCHHFTSNSTLDLSLTLPHPYLLHLPTLSPLMNKSLKPASASICIWFLKSNYIIY